MQFFLIRRWCWKCIQFLSLSKTVVFILGMSGGVSLAYIPSAKMILSKVVEGAIKTPLHVEQLVQLSSAQGTVFLKEQWLFENENSIRLIVQGEKDLQELISFQVHYSDHQRTSSLSGGAQTSKLSRPLFEKMFFIKNTENFMRFLVQHGVVGQEIFNSHNFKKIPGNNGFQYQPESFLRLGRTGGVVAYIFGPSPRDERLTPGLWVEQDLFHLLKMRNIQGEELNFNKLVSFGRGARWSKEMQLTWGTPLSTAQIQATSVKAADLNKLRPVFQKKINRRSPEFERHFGKNLIEEFYSRFR